MRTIRNVSKSPLGLPIAGEMADLPPQGERRVDDAQFAALMAHPVVAAWIAEGAVVVDRPAAPVAGTPADVPSTPAPAPKPTPKPAKAKNKPADPVDPFDAGEGA